MVENNRLHLPDLSIRGFRGIDDLTIPRLRRVTLLAGKNSVGKTTVLEAVQVYADRGRFSSLYKLLVRRDEMRTTVGEDSDPEIEPHWSSLFHGRDSSDDFVITVGPELRTDSLVIHKTYMEDEQPALREVSTRYLILDDRIEALKIEFRDKVRYFPLTLPYTQRARNEYLHRGVGRFLKEDGLPPAVKCDTLGPELLRNGDIARYWDAVALTEDERHATNALRMIFGAELDRVAVIGDDRRVRGVGGRRVVAKLKSYNDPVPLRSLSDGALRIFGTALALINSRGGFLLIDEIENGIHHSILRDFWRMILQSANENNVQVIATTHSWDCVKGFAQASSELDDTEGVLVRLTRQYGDLRAVEYSEEELAIAAEQGIEVR